MGSPYQRRIYRHKNHVDDAEYSAPEPPVATGPSAFQLMQEKHLPKAMLDIQAQKEQLAQKISAIKHRLIFGYSEPLNSYYMELIQQDMQLSCRLTDLLLV